MLAREKLTGIQLDGIEDLASRITTGVLPLSQDEAKETLDAVTPGNPMSPFDAARFFVTIDPGISELFSARAKELKKKVFGDRVVLFAPLYLSSRCSNNCLYCGFRRDNREISRVTLSSKEATAEASILEAKGYRRLLLVCGESSGTGQGEYIARVMRSIYLHTGMKILHVNAAPMTVKDLKKIKDGGAGVHQVFQETYRKTVYREMHPEGRKADYHWRLSCMDRAVEAGFDDLGIGALLGLYDWKFDAIATILHAIYLKERYGFWPHTLSVPRFRYAPGAKLTRTPHTVSDEDFLKVVASYRLCVPPAGVVVSTREPGWLRESALNGGASQISAGSNTSPGGYGRGHQSEKEGQFSLEDRRSLDEMIEALLENSHIPSLCTSCYRSGRTGQRFMEMTAGGEMHDFCHANALLSLAEYASGLENRKLAEKCLDLIRKESARVSPTFRGQFERLMAGIMSGEKDRRF